MGWLLPPGADRRRALAINYGLQLCGSLVLLAAGGSIVPLLLFGVGVIFRSRLQRRITVLFSEVATA